MLEHLQVYHDYMLISCNLKHDHTSSCYKLEEDFVYEQDAILSNHYKKTPLPTANLYDHRRKDRKKTLELALIATLPPPPPPLASSSTLPSVPVLPSSLASTTRVDDEAALRACINEFDPTGELIPVDWVNNFVEAEMSVADFLEPNVNVEFYSTMGVTIKPGRMQKLHSFMRKWSREHLGTE